MRYVHEFVDEMACMRCPHNAPATEENGWEGFDYVCYAREDGDEFLFPEECPTYFGPWGAWRAVLGQIVPVCDEWGFLLAGQPTRIAALSPASYDYFRAVGWSP